MEDIVETEPNRRATYMAEMLTDPTEVFEQERMFDVIVMFTVDALLTEDESTLAEVANFCRRARHPSFKLCKADKARCETLIEVISHAAMRIMPQVSESELTYLQMADGNYYKKEKDSEFTKEEWHLMNLGCMVNRMYFMELTPKGEEVLSRTRLEVERPATQYRRRTP